MVVSKNLLNSVQDYVLHYLKNNLSPQLTFHNVNHTIEVVSAAREIGSHCDLSKEQFNIIQIAAWFHDCGYAEIYSGHENISKKIAEDFLKGHDCSEEVIKSVFDCIEATRYPQDPKTLEAQIVCDADLYHFTRPDYDSYEVALRIELRKYFKQAHSDREWAGINCEMLQTHQYFTNYGSEVLQKFKEVNLERMKCRYRDLQTD